MKTQDSPQKRLSLGVTLVTLTLLLLMASLELMNASPLPKISWVLIGLGGLIFFTLLRQKIPHHKTIAFGLCVCAWLFCLRPLMGHPVMRSVESVNWTAALPVNESGKWEILPFYFSLAAWPLKFQNEAVSYRIPYEKGPPDRFMGHIEAFWKFPSVKVTFEGPKTPALFQDRWTGEKMPREAIHTCLNEVSSLFTLRYRCLEIREELLLRHTREIQKQLLGHTRIIQAQDATWKLEWVTIANPVIPASQQAQGILITAQSPSLLIQRWVLITERGSHQSIQLSVPMDGSETSRVAEEDFRKSLESLRITEDLNLGRAWISKSLETLRPEENLSRAHALWASQLSIEPAKLEPYILLGQTAQLLPNSSPLLNTMARYAEDIAAEDPKTLKLKKVAEDFSSSAQAKRR